MTAPAGAPVQPPAARTVLDRRVTVFCLAAVVVVVSWSLMDHFVLQRVSPVIATVGIVVGIPHGAMDHLVPGLASRRWSTPGHLVVVGGAYVAIAAVAALALLSAPDVSFAVFLVASALHFGWAETTYAAERNGPPGARWRDGWWATIAHGSVVVVLASWSAESQSAMRPLVPGLVDVVAAVPTRWVTGAVVVTCGLVVLRLLTQRRVLEAVELIAILALFLAVPVFAAFGVYFGLWHAVRHTTRLMDLLAPGEPMSRQLRAFARAATLPTAAALVVLALLFTSRSHVGLVMTGVSLLLALTFPHVVVVALLDRHRRTSPTKSTPT